MILPIIPVDSKNIMDHPSSPIPHQPIVLGLGSNLGDRKAMLEAALRHLREAGVISQVRMSPIYETPALLPEGAPADWDIPFYNAVAVAATTLEPEGLLQAVKQAERALGRQDRGHWGPREIDIDILSYGALVRDEAELTLPHPRLHERAFVLLPLCDILPFWMYRAGGKYAGRTAQNLLDALPQEAKAQCCKTDEQLKL